MLVLNRIAFTVVRFSTDVFVAGPGLPLLGPSALTVVAGIGLSVRLGFSCRAVPTAAVVTPLHLPLRALA